MASPKKRVNFFASDEGAEAKDMLDELDSNKSYKTESSYSADAEAHPDNLISFVDKHMAYLSSHPAVDIKKYISNLRIMTRIR